MGDSSFIMLFIRLSFVIVQSDDCSSNTAKVGKYFHPLKFSAKNISVFNQINPFTAELLHLLKRDAKIWLICPRSVQEIVTCPALLLPFPNDRVPLACEGIR